MKYNKKPLPLHAKQLLKSFLLDAIKRSPSVRKFGIIKRSCAEVGIDFVTEVDHAPEYKSSRKRQLDRFKFKH